MSAVRQVALRVGGRASLREEGRLRHPDLQTVHQLERVGAIIDVVHATAHRAQPVVAEILERIRGSRLHAMRPARQDGANASPSTSHGRSRKGVVDVKTCSTLVGHRCSILRRGPRLQFMTVDGSRSTPVSVSQPGCCFCCLCQLSNDDTAPQVPAHRAVHQGTVFDPGVPPENNGLNGASPGGQLNSQGGYYIM